MTEDALRTLHEHLGATAELPVDTPASHYLGEAEAVVADALKPGTSESVVRQRVEQAQELLSEVEETGSTAANDHVQVAMDCCEQILASGE